jgi:EVE domain
MKCWLNTISRDHAQVGVEGGFTQAGHGKGSRLKRLGAGDWLVVYSAKTSLEGGERLQAFTAIGRVADDELYQVEMARGFVPWRRNVNFVKCVETPIASRIDSLSFIKDNTRWGYTFRTWLVRDPAARFRDQTGDGHRPSACLAVRAAERLPSSGTRSMSASPIALTWLAPNLQVLSGSSC